MHLLSHMIDCCCVYLKEIRWRDKSEQLCNLFFNFQPRQKDNNPGEVDGNKVHVKLQVSWFYQIAINWICDLILTYQVTWLKVTFLTGTIIFWWRSGHDCGYVDGFTLPNLWFKIFFQDDLLRPKITLNGEFKFDFVLYKTAAVYSSSILAFFN